MTDKQIIIDNVDVSGCEFYHYIEGDKYPHKCSCYKDMYGYSTVCDLADCCKNCYYKQLKRKEQECEELKEGYSKLTDIVSPYMDDFTGYNEELGGFDIVLCVKELMEQLDKLKEQIKYQQNFIDSLLLATNNSEWLEKSILDDEASEIIEKIEMDYIEFEEGKEINAELKAENEKLKEFQKLLEEQMKFNKSELELSLSSEIKRSEFLLKEFKKVDKQRDNWREQAEKLEKTLTEIKEIAEENIRIADLEGLNGVYRRGLAKQILQKISEYEVENGNI